MTLHKELDEAECDLKIMEIEVVAEELKKMKLGYSHYFKCFSHDMMWLIKNRERILRNRKLIELLG